MSFRRSRPFRFVTRGYSDALDGTNTQIGACSSLQNLVFDPSTAGVLQCRPAAVEKIDFSSFSSPGVVSSAVCVGNLVYGLIGTARNAGKEEPFCYDLAHNQFLSVGNVLASNTPYTPPTTGTWTAPCTASLGGYVLFCHPGFDGTNGHFGWFDVTGFSETLTASTVSGSTSITGTFSLSGISPGMHVVGAGIPAGATVVDKSISGTTSTLVLSAAATTSASVSVTVSGGALSSPLWCSGNISGSRLLEVPSQVLAFYNRFYFSYENTVAYTDTLALNATSSAQSFTVGDRSSITAMSPMTIKTMTQGGLEAFIVLKKKGVWQITGDAALNNLTVNSLNIDAGTEAPLAIAPCPDGVRYIATDGVRKIDPYGNGAEPDQDARIPFLSALYSSRMSGAYNSNVYRVSVQNSAAAGTPWQDYWYDLSRKAWSGPHTFQYDLAVPWDKGFLLFSHIRPGKGYYSEVFQTPGSSVSEGGADILWLYRTAPLPDKGDMMLSTCCYSTFSMALSSDMHPVVFTAVDENNGVKAQGTVSPAGNTSVWGMFIWGADKWGATQYGLKPYTIPWDQRFTFSKVVFQASGVASLGLKFGNFYAMYEPTLTADQV